MERYICGEIVGTHTADAAVRMFLLGPWSQGGDTVPPPLYAKDRVRTATINGSVNFGAVYFQYFGAVPTMFEARTGWLREIFGWARRPV